MSGFIPKDFITSLLSRVDIVQLIHSVVPLKKMGASYKACCPFHDEKSPSFNVSAQKQFYHCFGCGASGNALGFVMRFHRLEFVAAVEKLAAPLGLVVPRENNYQAQKNDFHLLYECLEKVASYYHGHAQNPAAKKYLEKRELSADIIKAFQIGFSPPGWDGLLKEYGSTVESKQVLSRAGLLVKKEDGGFYDRFRERLMFPIRDLRGRVIGFGGRVIGSGEPKYLNSPETEIFHKGFELYGLYEARQASKTLPRLLVVEGYMDVVALAQYGIRYAVATLGTATTPHHIDVLFRQTSEVVFCFDGDAAGQEASRRALKIVLPLMREGFQVKFMFLEPQEDPDSQVRKEGAELFTKRIAGATGLVEFFLMTLIKQVDLTQVEGKAALVALARPYVASIASELCRHLVLNELSRLVKTDLQTLTKMMGGASVPALPVLPVNQGKLTKIDSLVRYAMALLLQYPALIQQVSGPIEEYSAESSYGLLNRLIEFLRLSPFLSTQDVIDAWPHKQEAEMFLTMASLPYEFPLEGLESEFLGALHQIQRQGLESEIARLLQAKGAGLGDPNMGRLQELLLKKRQLVGRLS